MILWSALLKCPAPARGRRAAGRGSSPARARGCRRRCRRTGWCWSGGPKYPIFPFAREISYCCQKNVWRLLKSACENSPVRLHLGYFGPPEVLVTFPTGGPSTVVMFTHSLALVEHEGMLFSPILPQIWISTGATNCPLYSFLGKL